MNNSKEKPKYIAVGGQALMEGIMMRGPEGTFMSLRMPDKSIETTKKDFVSIRKKVPILRIPLIRGIASFIESLVFGYKCLMESAEKTSLDDIKNAESESKLDKWLSDHFGPKMMAVIGFISMILSFALAFLLFMYAPSKGFSLLNKYLFNSSMTAYRAIFEGLIRIVIFVLYMYIVSKMSEIHRVYMYHGAEHKSIFCFEAGLELTVENVRKQKRCHPRCGTSFIFMSILISIIVSSVFSVCLPESIVNVTWKWMLVKFAVLPLILGIGFEFIQFAGKHQNACTRALSAPGLWLQRITTAEPTDDIVEVGIASLKAALSGEIPPEEMPKATAEKNGGEQENESKESEEKEENGNDNA